MAIGKLGARGGFGRSGASLGGALPLQLVATKAEIPDTYAAGAADSNWTNGDSRMAIRIGPRPVSQLRLAYANFIATGSGDVDGDNAVTVRAGIEQNGPALTTLASWGGASSGTINPSDNELISDPINLNYGAGRLLAIRSNIQVSSGQRWIAGHLNMGGSVLAGETGLFENQIRNTLATVVGNTGSLSGTVTIGVSPIAIIGIPSHRHDAVAIFGDSIGDASGDSSSANLTLGQGIGFVARGLYRTDLNFVPYTNLSHFGDAVQLYGGPAANSARRFRMLKYCTTALFQVVRNDVSAGTALATLKGYFLTAWARAKAYGVRVGQVKCPPSTTGTFTSAAGQSYFNANFAPGALRDQINAWFDTQVGGGLLDFVLDPNPVWEDQSAPGKWVSTGGVARTNDGTHPNTQGHQEGAAGTIQPWADSLAV